MQIAVEAVGVFLAEVAIDAANGEVHLGHPPSRVVGLLAIDADVAVVLSLIASVPDRITARRQLHKWEYMRPAADGTADGVR